MIRGFDCLLSRPTVACRRYCPKPTPLVCTRVQTFPSVTPRTPKLVYTLILSNYLIMPQRPAVLVLLSSSLSLIPGGGPGISTLNGISLCSAWLTGPCPAIPGPIVGGGYGLTCAGAGAGAGANSGGPLLFGLGAVLGP